MKHLHFPFKYNSVVVLLLLSLGCTRNTDPNTEPPGAEKSAKIQALEAGSELLQDEGPVNQISMYVNGFHFTSGHMEDQMEAHHYCTKLNEDVTQCLIYDGNKEDALLIGIEYIISKRLFETLPMEERQLWHSHDYEVKSGQLIAPGLPDLAENELMEELVTTYGKTWHTWFSHRDSLPVGGPNLMMGFTADGQIDPAALKDRDERFDESTMENREKRSDIPQPEVLPGANAWQEGVVKKLEIVDAEPVE